MTIGNMSTFVLHACTDILIKFDIITIEKGLLYVLKEKLHIHLLPWFIRGVKMLNVKIKGLFVFKKYI